MKNKILLTFLAVAMLTTACISKPVQDTQLSSDSYVQGNASPTEIETKIFTDSTGRKVEVPTSITKVAVTGQLGQIMMLSLAPDKLIGISNPWDETAKEFLDEEYYNLPVLGQLYGTKGEINLEELIKAQPQVVIDIGETSDKICDDMNALQDQAGIPFVHIDSSLKTTKQTYAMLGDLLDLNKDASILADYCEETYQEAQDLIKQVGDNKVRLIYCLGDKGLNVIAKGSYHAETLDLMAENIAVVENPTSKGTGNEVDLEQLLLWDPDVILFAPNSIYDSVGTDPAWLNLRAIADAKYFKVPYGPYNWMGMPPSVQRYLGLMWIGGLLYPDQVQDELQPKVQEYFKLFYHCDLTQEQYDRLMIDSIKH